MYSSRILTVYLILFSGCFLFFAQSQTYIGGELKNKTIFNSDGNPYVVGENLIIAKGDTLFVKKGTILLFNNYTGIEVFGSLIVDGQDNDPVIFTSVNDGRYNPKAVTFPNPFDWNGISIDLKSDEVKLYNIKLCYSVYGIKSYNQRMVIKNSVFHDNGQYDLVINETIQSVEPKIPFSYNYREEKEDDSTSTRRREPLTPYEQKLQNKKVIVISTLSLGVISGGLGGYFGSRFANAVDKYNDERGSDHAKYTSEKIRYFTLTMITGGISVVSLTTSLITQLRPVKLSIEKSTEKSNMQLDNFRLSISANQINLFYNF